MFLEYVPIHFIRLDRLRVAVVQRQRESGAHRFAADHGAARKRPGALIDSIDTLLATDPEHRYQTAGAVEAALRRWLEQPPAAQPRHRVGYAAAMAAAALLLPALIVGAVSRHRSQPTLVETRGDVAPFALKAGDWIVVSEFENQTGDAVLNGTIRAAVERELEYSDYVRVVQRDRIEDALKLLGRPLDSPLNRDLALQLSQRDGGIRALVSGAIAKADHGYRLAFDVFDRASQAPQATFLDQAPAPSDVLAAVRRQTLRMREFFGEPSASIERSCQALERAALPSVHALNLFTQAKTAVNLRQMSPVSEWARIETIAREVIEEAPAFPGGHLLPGWALANQGRRAEKLVHAKRAWSLAHSATPQERSFIEAAVHSMKVEGRGADSGHSPAERQELEKAAAAMEALFALQPDHYALKNNLRILYQTLGRERDLAWMHQRLADARPLSISVNLDVAYQLLKDGNVDGARRYRARAESALSPGSSAADPDLAASVRLFDAHVAGLQDDPDETLRVLQQVAASVVRVPDSERRELQRRLSTLYAAVGRLRDAEDAIEGTRSVGRTDLVSELMADLARAELFSDRGEPIRIRDLTVTRWDRPLPSTALAILSRRVPLLIQAGLLDAAERDLEWFTRRTANASEWAPRVPTRQFRPFYASNAGALELARGRPAAAVALIRREMPEIRRAPPWIRQPAMMNMAEALAALGNVSEAIGTLEEAVGDRVAAIGGNTPNLWVRASAHLARLYRKSGQEARARPIEARLLRLLAAADGDHPVVLELRRMH